MLWFSTHYCFRALQRPLFQDSCSPLHFVRLMSAGPMQRRPVLIEALASVVQSAHAFRYVDTNSNMTAVQFA